jgi:hypothetical protein
MDGFWILFLVAAIGLLSYVINYWMFLAQKAAWLQLAAKTGLECSSISFLGYQLRANGQYQDRAVEVSAHRPGNQDTTARALTRVQSQSDIGIYPADAVISAARNFLGRKQFKVEDSVLNRRLAFFTNDEALLRQLLASNAVNQRLAEIRSFDHLEIKNGWVEFQQRSIPTNVEALVSLLDLVVSLAKEYEITQVVS